MTQEQLGEYLAALVTERAHAERRGDGEKVAEIDEELQRASAGATPPAGRATTRTKPRTVRWR